LIGTIRGLFRVGREVDGIGIHLETDCMCRVSVSNRCRCGCVRRIADEEEEKMGEREERDAPSEERGRERRVVIRQKGLSKD
jgi:hypothetical protein